MKHLLILISTFCHIRLLPCRIDEVHPSLHTSIQKHNDQITAALLWFVRCSIVLDFKTFSLITVALLVHIGSVITQVKNLYVISKFSYFLVKKTLKAVEFFS